MTLDAIIMLAGAFVAVLPFLGFPNSWDSVLFFLAGVFIISLGIMLRRRSSGSTHNTPPKSFETFVENTPQSKGET